MAKRKPLKKTRTLKDLASVLELMFMGGEYPDIESAMESAIEEDSEITGKIYNLGEIVKLSKREPLKSVLKKA
jgi:hypothetical protein